MKKPIHYRHQDIVFEHLASASPDERRWVILCDGLPAVPQRHALLTELAAAGWHAVFPRYVGTWESPGHFLAASPADDIAKIIEATAAGTLITEQPPANKITLLGSSFGGAVALSLSGHPNVSRTVALSPVTSFRAIAKDLATLPAYLREMYPGAYRFEDSNWERLISDELLDPNLVNSGAIMKTAIIAGIEDRQLPIDDTRNFAFKHAHVFFAWPNLGHLGFSQITGELLEAVVAHLDSAEMSDDWWHRHAAKLSGAETIEI